MNNGKCLNWLICHNNAAKGSSLCEQCRRAAIQLTEQDDPRRTLAQLEKKPRDVRDAWRGAK